MEHSKKYKLLLVAFISFSVVFFSQQVNATQSKICIIRHAKVAIAKPGWGKTSDAKKYKMEYNTSSVITDIPENVQIKIKQFNDLKSVHCSLLPRSEQTAKLLFGDSINIIADSRFNELDYPVIDVPLLKLPVKFLLSTSRLLWFLNLNNKSVDSFKTKKNEIKKLVDDLVKLADEERTIVIVGHGIQMRQMIKELKKRGWKPGNLEGYKNLSMNCLVNS